MAVIHNGDGDLIALNVAGKRLCCDDLKQLIREVVAGTKSDEAVVASALGELAHELDPDNY